jgi:hypothetical protein
MRRHLKRYLFALGLALVVPLLALATLVFQKIDQPFPYIATLPSGINDAGWIVGTSYTHKEAKFGIEEGFLLRDGQYQKIFYPTGARDTDLGGVNDVGEIVGTYGDLTFKDHCFLRDKDGFYSPFDMPSSFSNATNPDCNGINQGGDTVGSYSDGVTNHGWWRTAGGTFYRLDVSISGASNTEAWGINKGGDIVGSYERTGIHGFLLRKGSYSPIDFASATNTHAFGINDEGDIVGSYSTATMDHGFLLREGHWKTVDVNLPGAVETNRVSGINDHGCMVGVYTGTDTQRHGFEASSREADAEGDEPGKNGGTAQMDFHEDDCNQQPEKEDYSDPGAGIDFHSTQVLGVTYDEVAHTVTIAGLGTNNTILPVAFTIVAVDSTAVPPGMFSITLSNGYSNSSSLLGGTITLR